MRPRLRVGPEPRHSPPPRRVDHEKPGKNSAISRAADSGPSLPCTRFSVSSIARSPRIVPGAASRGFVVPMSVRITFQASGPSTTIATKRRTRDERNEVVEERLPVVLGVVPFGGRRVERAQFEARRSRGPCARSARRSRRRGPRSTASGLQRTSVRSAAMGPKATGEVEIYSAVSKSRRHVSPEGRTVRRISDRRGCCGPRRRNRASR